MQHSASILNTDGTRCGPCFARLRSPAPPRPRPRPRAAPASAGLAIFTVAVVAFVAARKKFERDVSTTAKLQVIFRVDAIMIIDKRPGRGYKLKP